MKDNGNYRRIMRHAALFSILAAAALMGAFVLIAEGNEVPASYGGYESIGMRPGVPGNEPPIDITPVEAVNRIVPSRSQVEIPGTDGNDYISGNDLDNVFYGYGGSNVYEIGPDEGDDVIENESWPGKINILRFAPGISPEDVDVSRIGADMVFSLFDGSVTISGWNESDAAKLDRVEFYEGIYWDAIDVERLADGKPLTERMYITYNEQIPGEETSETTEGELSQIFFDEGSYVVLALGEVYVLSVYGLYDDGFIYDISSPEAGTVYVSTNPAVASVREDGMVHCQRGGEAQIIARNADKTAVINLTVVE